MWAAILALFPTVAGWINLIVGFFQNRAAAQNSANTAENTAMSEHQSDGAQSVADKISGDAQLAALKKLADQMDNPTPVVVIKDGK